MDLKTELKIGKYLDCPHCQSKVTFCHKIVFGVDSDETKCICHCYTCHKKFTKIIDISVV